MKLFHGSTVAIEKPVMLDTQRLLDFGNGFYTTTNQKQAESWALIKQKRLNKDVDAVISVYKIDDPIIHIKRAGIKVFESATEEWLDFVVDNRNGRNKHPYDIVRGPVANDTLYSVLLLYENEVLSKLETITRLKIHKLFDQISFHNSKILQKLEFVRNYELDK